VAESGAGMAGFRGDVYGLVRKAVVERRPVSCIYHSLDRLFCPHRLGRNKESLFRVLCYQFGGESESGLKAPGSAANWRCLALDELSRVELLDSEWHTAPNHSRPTTCIAEVDVDAEDYPERNPQQGHSGSNPTR
jgi:hypothetical protein